MGKEVRACLKKSGYSGKILEFGYFFFILLFLFLGILWVKKAPDTSSLLPAEVQPNFPNIPAVSETENRWADSFEKEREIFRSIEQDLVWEIAPQLEYEEIRFFHEFGFIGYNNAGMDMWILDRETGEKRTRVDPEDGFRVPYLYIYSGESGDFFYNEDHGFHPEPAKRVRQLSQDKVISVYLLAQGQADEVGEEKLRDFWAKDAAGFAIYFNGTFATDFIFDEVIGGNSVAIVKQGQRYALAGGDGELRTDFIFDEVFPVVKKYAAVKEQGVWGFTDSFGQEVIPFAFEDALIIDEDRAFVKSLSEISIGMHI